MKFPMDIEDRSGNQPAYRSWHLLESEDSLMALQSRRSGLTPDEISARHRQHGPNELAAKETSSPLLIFLRQFSSPLVYVLLTAAVVKIVVGGYLDAGVIAVVLLLMAAIGYFQEIRAEAAMEALMKLAAPRAKVRRDDQIVSVLSTDIVPGDILVLETGDRVAADARLLRASNFKMDESLLTGESMPVSKHTDILNGDISIADRKNMVHMGTTVTSGRSTAVVTATGMKTEIGRIASAIQQVEPEKTPLQKSIARLGNAMIVIVLALCLFLVIAGLLRGIPAIDIFLLAVAAAVSAIPEGLPAVVTVVLAVGMRFMARRNAVIRRLVAVETLGSATVICSDKTGTLTMNQMTVKRLFADGRWIDISGQGYRPEGEFTEAGDRVQPFDDPLLNLHLRIGILCNDALLSGTAETSTIIGDPTEGALLVAANKAGMDKESAEKAYPRLEEIPFQSENQYMATLHTVRGKHVVYIKGSLERMLSLSGYIHTRDGRRSLTDQDRDRILRANATMANEAMRVIAAGYCDLADEQEILTEEHLKNNAVFVGLFGMIDPPRPEAIQAVSQCKRAGIRVVMITGDNKLTATAVAQQLGLEGGETVTGDQIQHMTDRELTEHIEDISVFARIEPLHKLKIVRAFREQGHVVAMTGDGVNDAPALKAASIGVAMGLMGTDVAKEASDVVLADDNFASVVAAVEEGRAIFGRLRNVVFFLLTTCFGELFALILSVIFLGKGPLLAIQILWVNLVTGTIMSIPLGLEPKAGDELLHPPRDPAVGLLYRGLLCRVAFLAAMLGGAVFLIFQQIGAFSTLPEARTAAFCTMVTFEWFVAFNARSDEHTIFKLGILKNRALVFALLIAIVLQLTVVYAPPLQFIFKTVPLKLNEWGIIVGIGLGIFLLESLRKIIFPKLFSRGKWRRQEEKKKFLI
jgi:Ca2+-transporting ATPase